MLNEKKIDLAYTFIKTPQGWKNLAIHLNLPVEDVSEYIVLDELTRRVDFAEKAINECKNQLKSAIDSSSNQAEMNIAVYDKLDCLISRVAEYMEITNNANELEVVDGLNDWISKYITFTRNYIEGSKMCDDGCRSFYSSYPAQNAILLLEFTLIDMAKYE